MENLPSSRGRVHRSSGETVRSLAGRTGQGAKVVGLAYSQGVHFGLPFGHIGTEPMHPGFIRIGPKAKKPAYDVH
jgi:hypothetical protein